MPKPHKKVERKATRKPLARRRRVRSTAIVPIEKPKQIDFLRQQALRTPSIEEYARKHSEIRHFLRKNLKAGIDYDQIPGTNGKTLLQPGAERIALWLKVRPYFETVETPMEGGHIEVVVRTHMLPTLVYDLIMQVIEKGGANIESSVQAIIRASELSNATASCSTMETNFRYRWADMRDENEVPIQPDKMKAARLKAINMGRHLPAKMHWSKIVPMTQADKKAKMAVEYWIWQERVENPNIYDERNKVRQMGEKRSFVKSIKRMGALSEVFQEDPNEWPETLDVRPEAPPEEPFKPGAVERNEPAQPKPEPPKAKGQVSVIWQDKDLARVGGDTKTIEDMIVRSLLGTKLHGKEEFLVQACYIPTLFELCQRENLQVTETQHKPKPASPTCVEESGIIKNVKKSDAKAKTQHVQVLFNQVWFYCYSKTMWGFLFAGITQQAILLINRKEGRAPTIEGARQIGSTKFGEDGKTPLAA